MINDWATLGGRGCTLFFLCSTRWGGGGGGGGGGLSRPYLGLVDQDVVGTLVCSTRGGDVWGV